MEAGRPYPSQGKTSRRDRNAHLELKALQKQAPHSPAPQPWEPLERARGGCGNLGKGLGGAAPDSPLPTSSHLLSAVRCTYYQGSCGAWAPGPLFTAPCSASLTLRTPGSWPESWTLGWERPWETPSPVLELRPLWPNQVGSTEPTAYCALAA